MAWMALKRTVFAPMASASVTTAAKRGNRVSRAQRSGSPDEASPWRAPKRRPCQRARAEGSLRGTGLSPPALQVSRIREVASRNDPPRPGEGGAGGGDGSGPSGRRSLAGERHVIEPAHGTRRDEEAAANTSNTPTSRGSTGLLPAGAPGRRAGARWRYTGRRAVQRRVLGEVELEHARAHVVSVSRDTAGGDLRLDLDGDDGPAGGSWSAGLAMAWTASSSVVARQRCRASAHKARRWASKSDSAGRWRAAGGSEDDSSRPRTGTGDGRGGGVAQVLRVHGVLLRLDDALAERRSSGEIAHRLTETLPSITEGWSRRFSGCVKRD